MKEYCIQELHKPTNKWVSPMFITMYFNGIMCSYEEACEMLETIKVAHKQYEQENGIEKEHTYRIAVREITEWEEAK